jgi:hypothetical protein
MTDARVKELEDVNAELTRQLAEMAKANADLVRASTEAVRKYLGASEGLERERKRVISMQPRAETGPRAVPTKPQAPPVRRSAADVEKEFQR